MSVVHLTASWILLVATALHVAGALKHALARDGVMARMAFAPLTVDVGSARAGAAGDTASSG